MIAARLTSRRMRCRRARELGLIHANLSSMCASRVEIAVLRPSTLSNFVRVELPDGV